MYTEARHFSRFVARNCWKNPSAERISTVSLVQVPDLYLWTRYLFQIQFSGSDTTALCFRLLWRTAHLLEGLFHVRPAPLIQGCCAASAGRGVLPATCRPEKMSTAGSASKARSCHPYVTLWGLSTVIYSWSKRCCKLDMWQFKSGHSYNNIVEYIYS